MPDPLDPEEFVLVDPSDYPIAASAIANQARWERRRHAQDLRLDHLAERRRGQRRRHPRTRATASSRSRTRPSPRTATRPSGGGLYTEGGNVTVSGSTISKNQAANGGGLYSGGHVSQHGLRGTFTVTDSQVAENIAENGGGLFNDGDAQLSVTDTIVHEEPLVRPRRARSRARARSNMTLTRVTVTENVSNGEGGGIWTHSERQQTIVDSTFTKNKAGVPIIEDDGTLSDDVAGGGGAAHGRRPAHHPALDLRRQRGDRGGRRPQPPQPRRRRDRRQHDHRTTARSTAAAWRTAPRESRSGG